ncbi:MAG: hypothetical protein AAGG69_08935, partial [Pseudomonadota bacterium]
MMARKFQITLISLLAMCLSAFAQVTSESVADPSRGVWDLLDFHIGSSFNAGASRIIITSSGPTCVAALKGELCEAVKSAGERVLEVETRDEAKASESLTYAQFDAFGESYTLAMTIFAAPIDGVYGEMKIFGPRGAISTSRVG